MWGSKKGGDPEKCTLFLAGSFSSSIHHIEQKSQHQECSQGWSRVEVSVVGAVNQNLFTEKESGNRGSKYSEGKELFGYCSKGRIIINNRGINIPASHTQKVCV